MTKPNPSDVRLAEMSPSMSREEYEIIVKDIPYDILVKELMHRLARGEEVKRYLKVVEEFANTK